MAAARGERPAALRVTVRYSRLALALTLSAFALAAIAVGCSRLAAKPFAMVVWVALALAAGFLVRALGAHCGIWQFDESADGIGRLRPASASMDDAPDLRLRRTTCWPFLLAVEAVEVTSGRSTRLVVMFDALPRDDFRRLSAWLRLARCAPDAGPK